MGDYNGLLSTNCVMHLVIIWVAEIIVPRLQG